MANISCFCRNDYLFIIECKTQLIGKPLKLLNNDHN